MGRKPVFRYGELERDTPQTLRCEVLKKYNESASSWQEKKLHARVRQEVPPRSSAKTAPHLPLKDSRRQRNAKLLADSSCGIIRDFPMTGYRGAAACDQVLPNRMFCTFTHELAAMLMQMSQQVAPFHRTASWGTRATRDAACKNRWIGSSKSASRSVQVGSG